jgi:decaprenylphospho-beta-D-ribofuranose 2-oxidase
MTSTRQLVTGWGRHGAVDMHVVEPSDRGELERVDAPNNNVVPRGLGRSYGDAAQRADGTALVTTGCRRVEWIDQANGVLRADAGVTIGELIQIGIPLGYFVPVSPGTRNVTVGGAIAADIHGKNHHVDGSFGEHVLQLTLRLADDSIVECSPAVEADLFWATVGGMGLTGVIIDAVITMAAVPSSTISVETTRHGTLDELMDVMRNSDADHDFSVAWVDLLTRGRSVLTQGGFADAAEVASHPAGPLRRPRTPSAALPPLPPVRWVQRPFVRAFNELWFRRAPAEQTVTQESITGFFHPLDAIRDWNRLYGSTGFVQWQCVRSAPTLPRSRRSSRCSSVSVLRIPLPCRSPRPGGHSPSICRRRHRSSLRSNASTSKSSTQTVGFISPKTPACLAPPSKPATRGSTTGSRFAAPSIRNGASPATSPNAWGSEAGAACPAVSAARHAFSPE